ncbi:MAG: hypothetical protein ABI132_02605 [Rhodanobacteraceae bacterium]
MNTIPSLRGIVIVERKIVDPNKVASVTGPGPRHDAGGTHGIILVGGHSQSRIDHDKAALNPQPIPPGHALRRIPDPGSPIEKKIGH